MVLGSLGLVFDRGRPSSCRFLEDTLFLIPSVHTYWVSGGNHLPLGVSVYFYA